MRDRLVLRMLAIGFTVALLTWQHIGHWPGLVVGLIAAAAAGVAYRIEPSRIDLDHPEAWVLPDGHRGRAVDQ